MGLNLCKARKCTPTGFDIIPRGSDEDLLTEIFLFLDSSDIFISQRVCHRFRDLVRETSLLPKHLLIVNPGYRVIPTLTPRAARNSLLDFLRSNPSLTLNNFAAHLQIFQGGDLVDELCSPLSFDAQVQALPEGFKDKLTSSTASEVILTISANRFGTHRLRLFPMRAVLETANGASLLKLEASLHERGGLLFGSPKQKLTLKENEDGQFKFSITFDHTGDLFGQNGPPQQLIEWLPNLTSLFDFRVGRGGLF